MDSNQDARKNVFVLALTDQQRRELETLHRAGSCAFHGLLSIEDQTDAHELNFSRLLEAARKELSSFDEHVDAIISHWDFPTSILAPILSADYGIPSPRLRSLLTCEHKYWSRLEQTQAVPECVPPFDLFDPFDAEALSAIEIPYPFWVKPVKAHSSSLGFRVDDADGFNAAAQQICSSINEMGEAFNEALALVDVPDEVGASSGTMCVAEGLVSGVQCAAEGSVFEGTVRIHGVLDMPRDDSGTSIARLDYPASIPDHVQERVRRFTTTFLESIGFDNGCFNSEFMWDPQSDDLRMIEVNTRISQSHSELFIKVDGVSNHKVALDVALGCQPSMPSGEGPDAVAAQCKVFHDQEAIVTRVPTRSEISALEKKFDGLLYTPKVAVGDVLSALSSQDSYRYAIAEFYIGADSHQRLDELHREIANELVFEFDTPPEAKG